MNLFDWLIKKNTSISRMTRAQLRRQEIILDRDRNRLVTRVQKISEQKQQLFERGTREKSPEMRRMLAQEFELKTSEQLMLARQLNIRSKEYLTVSRLRMLRENYDRNASASKLGLISESDMLRLSKLIENDSVKSEMYLERLDDILSIGARADESATGVGEVGQSVLDVWEKLDTGLITDGGEAFDEADRLVRERQAAE